MSKKISVENRTDQNTTLLTITPDRIVIKVDVKNGSKYNLNEWEKIANKLSEIPVAKSHRGMVLITPYGFYSRVKSDNGKSIFVVSYYEAVDKLVIGDGKTTGEESEK